jgi:hypothetical protein
MLPLFILSIAYENVTFPRMNYRQKKISMKAPLEEAIQEIGGEQLQGSRIDHETPEERSQSNALVAQHVAR